ncbi:hypothetical protein NC652_012090 [Populus alba x Populus x berolinensis]|nr:hypothetical protein NC652_012090 [Populus alba x Populus x berolinensis]
MITRLAVNSSGLSDENRQMAFCNWCRHQIPRAWAVSITWPCGHHRFF